MYRRRNPEVSPFFTLVRDHFDEFERVYDERFQLKYGYWRQVMRTAMDKFLKCADLREGEDRKGSNHEATYILAEYGPGDPGNWSIHGYPGLQHEAYAANQCGADHDR